MILVRTVNLERVRVILTHPKIYPLIGDDFAPDREQFKANEDPRIWYVLALDDDNSNGGLFTFLPDSNVCWQVHVSMLPEFWGEKAKQAGAEIVPWIWERTPCRRIIASVPIINRLALRYGVKVMGLQPFGVNKASFLKNGQMWDQVLLGVSKPQ
jgi:RimJ/RimL family protein N-acetyltransferase